MPLNTNEAADPFPHLEYSDSTASIIRPLCLHGAIQNRAKTNTKHKNNYKSPFARLTTGLTPCKVRCLKISTLAEVAELVDALASGASGLWPVEVQVLFSAPFLRIVLYRDFSL